MSTTGEEIEVAVVERGEGAKTEKVTKAVHEKLLAHRAALRCPIPAAFGFPLVVAPVSESCTEIAVVGELVGSVADSGIATTLLANIRAGTVMAEVTEKVFVLRSDSVPVGAAEVRAIEAAVRRVCTVHGDATVAREPNGLVAVPALKAAIEAQTAGLRQAIEASAGTPWRPSGEAAAKAFEDECPRNCRNCQRHDAWLVCSACHTAHYCGSSCSKANWPIHKLECSRIAKKFTKFAK